jgi:hypothetical protein
MSDKDIFALSDEEFANMAAPPAPEAAPPAAEPPAQDPVQEPVAEPVQEPAPEPAPQEPAPEPAPAADQNPLAQADDKLEAPKPAEAKPEPAKEPPAEPAKEEPKTDAPPNYEESYKVLTAPLRANGKTFEVRSPEDARRLMQKGLGAERLIQEMAPQRRILAMLDKAGVLDESRLSYAIDLLNGNQDAIKKLVKDSGIDPVDIDPGAPTEYAPVDRSVSENEIVFNDAIKEVKSLEGGQETIRTLHETWDPDSKEALFKNPGLLSIMHSHRETGIYARIAEEVERQKTLGTLDRNAPFLSVYKAIGDQVEARGGFADLPAFQRQAPQAPPAQPPQAPASPPSAPEPKRVAVVVDAPKPPVQNGPAARAAAPTKPASAPAQKAQNFFGMSDDEFMKQAGPH